MRQINKVGLRIIDKQHRNGIQAVNPADGGLFLYAKIDLGYIFQQDGPLSENNVFYVGNILVFCRYVYKIFLVRFMQVTGESPVL